MKRAYAYARLTGLPRERERGGDLCVATDALKNARVRDVNDTLYRGGGRGGRGQGSQTPVSLIGDASRNRSVEFDISVQSSATDPHLGWYMHFLFRSSPLASTYTRVRWSRHLLWVHNSREIINNTCDDTRAWAASPHGHLKHSPTTIRARLRSSRERCKNLIDHPRCGTFRYRRIVFRYLFRSWSNLKFSIFTIDDLGGKNWDDIFVICDS